MMSYLVLPKLVVVWFNILIVRLKVGLVSMEIRFNLICSITSWTSEI